MLSYQHAYHAGNRADVHKHAALARLLKTMTAKPRPVTYMETHAGRGLYDLAGPEAKKTGEAADGIQRLSIAGTDDPYFEAIDAIRRKHGRTAYPGSPLVARHLLRDTDAIHLMEKHPAEAKALKSAMKGSGAHVHFRDGYEGVLAISPPPARRGAVLIDPSYEVKTEYDDVARFVRTLHRKWPEAVILVWYPILEDGRHRAMIRALEAAGLPEAEKHEILFPKSEHAGRMLGSGLFIAGKPYGYALGGDDERS